ncbi:uncharacterized protein ARMOST_13600 [Armillaria ostoyae]|uniref:Uncharacterized protein n=1 Tax=Armillaria ostoyae TaxID=47428 RepID=A0A284RN75_ARMOS|nr:uncharacterized protein ARMOST_13600 [Armillaria ostoyae]
MVNEYGIDLAGNATVDHSYAITRLHIALPTDNLHSFRMLVQCDQTVISTSVHANGELTCAMQSIILMSLSIRRSPRHEKASCDFIKIEIIQFGHNVCAIVDTYQLDLRPAAFFCLSEDACGEEREGKASLAVLLLVHNAHPVPGLGKGH